MMLRISRRCLSSGTRLSNPLGGTKMSANAHTTYNSSSDPAHAIAKEDNPEYNREYFNSLYEILPLRPVLLGREATLAALREKEKGDWASLTADEQLTLYKSYFAKTLPEMLQGDDGWKAVWGIVFLMWGIAWLVAENVCIKGMQGIAPGSQGALWKHNDAEAVKFRKHMIYYDLCWENDNGWSNNQGYGDSEAWDYKNHCWKNPMTLRFKFALNFM